MAKMFLAPKTHRYDYAMGFNLHRARVVTQNPFFHRELVVRWYQCPARTAPVQSMNAAESDYNGPLLPGQGARRPETVS